MQEGKYTLNDMRKGIKFFVGLLLIKSIVGCQEITPISSDKLDSQNAATKCQPPPIEKNIIGTWRFESTFNLYDNTETYGTITFDNKGNVIDPDNLFGADMPDAIIKKEYNPKVNRKLIGGYEGELFEVYLTTRAGVGTYYFTLVSNECNKIHIRLLQSGNNGVGFYLKRT